MRKHGCLLVLGAMAVFSSCEKTSSNTDNYFDSLIVANTNELFKAKSTLTKYAAIGNKKDTVRLKPDSLIWYNELDVFRQLTIFQKPAYKDAYLVEDGLKDTQSNLTIKQYKAIRQVPVSLIQFYYFNDIKHLKKIEAHFQETNTLYTTTRHMVMEFDELHGKAILSHYSVNGVQRMILSDSLAYAIKADITFN